MPNISVFDGLSPDEIVKIEAEIANRNFRGYSDLSDWCKSHGWQIERGALWNRGSKLKKQLQNVKNATQVAKMYVDVSADDAGALSEATLSLVQSGLFEVLSSMQEADETDDPAERMKLFSVAARAAADVGRASISQKKWRIEVRTKLQAAAREAEPIAKKAGLSDTDWAAIRAKFLGVEIEST